MKRNIRVVFLLLPAFIGSFLFFGCQQSEPLSNVLPLEGSKLNYRLIGFSFLTEPNTGKYTIEIAAGNYTGDAAFKKNIIKNQLSDSNKLIAEVPYFGTQYTWRVVYTDKKNVTKNSSLYHFSTQTNARVDTTKLRLKILQPAAQQYRDDYVAVDGGTVLYDMNGRAIWFMPDTNGIGGYVIDLQFTPQHTITFLAGKDAYELNFNAGILWKAPNKGTINGDSMHGENYHHELRRLNNGHYMIMGTQMLMCRQVTTKDTSYIEISNSKIPQPQSGYVQARFGTLIEYDEKGNVVWSWKSSDHLIGSDFDYFGGGINSELRFDPHENSFFFDEKNKIIYLGFKHLNRVMKIEYPGGKVLRTYGDIFRPGNIETGKGLFCNQHNVSLTQDGYLCYFNNNSCMNVDSLPKVVLLKEPVSDKGNLEKVWEYTCTMEGNYPKIFNSGGSVTELPDRSLFVNMGSEYSKLFIVNRNKEVLWSAMPERFIETDRIWKPNKQYRASIITRKELEQLIWKAESITQH